MEKNNRYVYLIYTDKKKLYTKKKSIPNRYKYKSTNTYKENLLFEFIHYANLILKKYDF